MMVKRRQLWCLGLAWSLVTACSSKSAPPASDHPSSEMALDASVTAKPKLETKHAPIELAVPADFEAEVAAEVTAENYEATLDALERELTE